MKTYYKFIILFFVMLIASCRNIVQEPSFSQLSHASRQIHVNGETRKQILNRWGEPQGKLKKDFEKLKYRRPVNLPAFDEQWVYLKTMEWRIVYFDGGCVSLCVEEWSDF